jgi:microsomal epoxide hydrolase
MASEINEPGDVMPTTTPSPIAVAESALVDLRERLERARLDGTTRAQDWSLGPDGDFLAEFCRYWRLEHDWRAWERELNRWDPTMVHTSAGAVHCLHARSPHPNATPLLITHGWPGSIVEVVGLLDALTDPTAHGGSADDAFHVVCPSLPGYGFSPAPHPAVPIRKVGDLLSEAMTVLGYERFLAQGGDWGAIATSYLGIDHPERLLGIHLNTVLAYPSPDDPTAGLSPAELAQLARLDEFSRTGMAYVQVHATRPFALAPGLSDSPIGLPAWTLDKLATWSDGDGTLPGPFTLDALAANLSAYWFTQTIASSILLYTATVAAGQLGPLPARVAVPTACAIFPREILVPARRWAEQTYNVVQWTEMSAGGHFAALEAPAALVSDVRTFARTLRS